MSCLRCSSTADSVKTSVHWCTNCIVSDPLEWLEQNKRSRSKFGLGYYYLLTFTRNPNSKYQKSEWFKRILKELGRQSFSQVKANLEHIDTNIHCHSIVSSNKPISKTLFKVFQRDYGFVDLRRIVVDNGVDAYIVKDDTIKNPYSLEEFSKKYVDII